jgi:hypothetical protein
LERRCWIGSVALITGTISMGARREVLSAVAERYGSGARPEKGRIFDALCRTTGWHHKHAVRALRRRGLQGTAKTRDPRERKRRYGVTIKDALTALWEASDRVCGKRLVAMILTLLPALEQSGRLERGRRRGAGFYSMIRREVPIRTFNDWKDPAPGFCEVDKVAHGGTSVASATWRCRSLVRLSLRCQGNTPALDDRKQGE